MNQDSDKNDQAPRDPLDAGAEDRTEKPDAAPGAAGKEGAGQGAGSAPSGKADPAGRRRAQKTPPAQDPQPPRERGRRSGRVLASLALLLALAAAGGAGYLYYELIYQDSSSQTDERLADVRSTVENLSAQLERQTREQQAALERFRQQQADARAETRQALRESLNEVARQAPPSTGEWQRAEVQYLLRIANHRLLMERDVTGALRLLEAADNILDQLDDFALHEVRARLADEIAALENFQGTDLEGLFLRLESLKRDLDELPLRMPEYLAREPEPEPQAEDFWSALEERVSGFLRLRRFEGAVKPLLAPEEAVYLELNLRLMLERAQLAAVRGEQLIFEESIITAMEWIRRYLNTDETRVQRMLDELNTLAEVDLQRELPDISGSLNALREVLRNPG